MNAQRMKGGRAIGVCAPGVPAEIDREAAGAAHDVRNRPIVRMCYGRPAPRSCGIVRPAEIYES